MNNCKDDLQKNRNAFTEDLKFVKPVRGPFLMLKTTHCMIKRHTSLVALSLYMFRIFFYVLFTCDGKLTNVVVGGTVAVDNDDVVSVVVSVVACAVEECCCLLLNIAGAVGIKCTVEEEVGGGPENNNENQYFFILYFKKSR